METIANISDGWMPHSHCLLNDLPTITLHVVGDGVIALSYFLIPVGLILTSWKYRMTHTREFRTLLLHGAYFILLCGATHVMSIWNWWNTEYTISGILAMLCALVSASFVWRLWRFLKKHPLRSDGKLSKNEWID